MSPSTRNSESESRSLSGIVSLFKSLTGTRPLKHLNFQSHSPPHQEITEEGSRTRLNNLSSLTDYNLLLDQLNLENLLTNQIDAADSIRYALQKLPVDRVSDIIKGAKTLIDPLNPKSAREAGFELLIACAQNAPFTDSERMAYFSILKSPRKTEDFHWQLAALIELTHHGRELAGFHYEVLPVLTIWLSQTWAVTSSHRKKGHGMASLNQETDLALLLVFIFDVIKFNFNYCKEQAVRHLIEVVLGICTRTKSSDDLRSCVNVVDAIVTYGDVPSDKLADCVKVLCSIQVSPVIEARQETWKLISNIFISHNGKSTVGIILKILHGPLHKSKQRFREVRGALLVLEELSVKNGENSYPKVPFCLLINSLAKVSVVDNITIKIDILRLIHSLLSCDGKKVPENVLEEDWDLMFSVVVNCVGQILESAEKWPINHSSGVRNPVSHEAENSLDCLTQSLQKMIVRIQSLLVEHSSTDFFQRADCIKFLVAVHTHLPETCARLVIDFYMEYRYCYPSDLDWRENMTTLLRSFFHSRTQPTQIRLHALKAMIDVFLAVEAVHGFTDRETTEIFVGFIFKDIENEKNVLILEEIMGLTVVIAEATLEDDFFFQIIGNIHEGILRSHSPSHSISNRIEKMDNSSQRNPKLAEVLDDLKPTPSNVAIKALIKIFVLCMDKSKSKIKKLFEEFLWMAKNENCEVDARITVLRFLCRLRADWADRIFLTGFTESDGLAALFFRTNDSLSRRCSEEITSRQQRLSRIDSNILPSHLVRNTSIGNDQLMTKRAKNLYISNTRTTRHSHRMWMEPDNGPFDNLMTGKASSILVSVLDSNINGTQESRLDKNFTCSDDSKSSLIPNDAHVILEDLPIALDISQYLQIIIELIQNNCDWEIYSYIIVHLPSQLMNQGLFKAAIPQIRALREVLCDQIKDNSVQEPPIMSGLRKSDVSTCFFQILNVVMSYHRYFSKNEEDEIVRTFVHGVGDKTSKICIHALSICCHEIPNSTRKALLSILTKMSQIITQSHIAIHILEFLACLARLPNLYINFRENEYRIVFAICFRYLQYVRDKKRRESSSRNKTNRAKFDTESARDSLEPNFAESNLHPATSDDLPEYVNALAYQVIIFWFLSLKLPDRSSQVRWIIKNLVSTDSTNIDGAETVDEQVQVTLNFMQRVAYSDTDESGPDPSFKKEIFGKINTKRWIIGNSLLTVEQTTRGDWAQITKHQPSGTSSYMIQEKFCRPPPHQALNSTDEMKDRCHSDENIKLPSHLLLQLCTPILTSEESAQPVPLPDCKTIDRAVSNLNRTFTVVSHKIGVIYIGENQTNEVEILSNIQGSRDYTKFLAGLGTLTKLQGANFNTQGLDRRADTDGEYTLCWRDRVTEIIFHVTTQMPTDLDNDPQCSNKKKHIGNDFVNIIFNNSGLPFNFNTFPSEFNYVNIVITPESRATFIARRLQSSANNDFYKVQVMSKPGFPEISPAAETKIMSLSTLPEFIRLLSLNASVFSLVWANRPGGEHFSSWRSRLREINKIREASRLKPSNITYLDTSHETLSVRDSTNNLRRASINFLTQKTELSPQRFQDTAASVPEIKTLFDEERLLELLDFSKWA
ncbi:putative gtpase activating protein [Golovinomyces cichoracearum]|uniref:Putative gtpase activating protein n=1 Tax=Golovinomyces cichoracearum TaxID=62708 RepID=A0A420J2Y1_9PEZI|nr:putative gtpase activating protein [Golovinomyces cichoracearum]